jgi:hypothetical protein
MKDWPFYSNLAYACRSDQAASAFPFANKVNKLNKSRYWIIL